VTASPRRLAAGALALLALLLAALTAGSANAQPAASPIVLRDALGTVTLPGVAVRVVATEWSYVEDLLALGITPVGVADIAGYHQWVGVPRIPAAAQDVGTRQEPSLERIAALKPDLIIGPITRIQGSIDRLRSIAPVLAFDPYRGDQTQYQEMLGTFATIARATGRGARATAVVERLDRVYATIRKKLAAKGYAGRKLALAQAFTTQGAPTARLFTSNAQTMGVVRRLGLKNGWTAKSEQYGFSTVGLEALSRLPDDGILVYVAQPNDNPFQGTWANDAAYRKLPFVQQGRVYGLRPDTWTFGGPISMQQFAVQIGNLLTTR
jgi:iron complex transport system substrate-binding protein